MESYLKKLRKSIAMTTSEVATALGVTCGYYNKLENLTRTPSQEMQTKLADLFRVGTSTLMNDYVINKLHMKVLNSWIWKIKINDVPVLEAFKKESFLYRFNKEDDRLISDFIKFIEFNIGDSIRKELEQKNGDEKYLKNFLLNKLKYSNY